MQRLVKPSDYIQQDVLGQSMYLIPWEPRLCPGNPTDDPEAGAQLYNAFALEEARGVQQVPAREQMSHIVDWCLETPGEAARSLAADLAAACQGRHRFMLEDLQQWDADTRSHRAHLVFHHEDIARFPARTVMALRARAGHLNPGH